MISTMADYPDLALIGLISTAETSVGVALLLLLTLTNVLVPERRTWPGRLTTSIFVCALLLGVTMLLGNLNPDEAQRFGDPSVFCWGQAIVYQFLATAMVWLWVIITTFLWLVVCHNKSFKASAVSLANR